MSDREPPSPISLSDILKGLYYDSIKNKYSSKANYQEYKWLKKFNTLYSEYHRITYKLICLDIKSIGYEEQRNELRNQQTLLLEELAKLETSQPIQDILKKANKCDENIRMG